MRLLSLAALALLPSCALREPPRYMQEATDAERSKVAIAEIRKELGEEFAVEQMENIFFVATDAGKWSFDVCKGTITRVYGYLTKTYFEKKPEQPIRVFLFKDKASYDAYCKKTYGKEPSTPFGFYMSGERKMVMNIATGTGTLAHELVHPLLSEDFPDVPSWFNEGFASLYEQSGTDKEGRIYGQVNWRLPGLQKAFKENKAVPLDALLKTGSLEFYGDDRGVNYATARYLCMWLQEKGLLLKYYREFKAGAKDDPTGRAALEKVAERRLADLEKEWRDWVATLKYPP